MKFRLMLCAACVLMLTGFVVVRADDKPADTPKKSETSTAKGRLTKPWSEMSDLTDDEKGKIKEIHSKALEDIKAMTKRQQITLHHCIQGWSGIAEWGGLPMAELIALVRPKPNARVAVFYSFGEGLEGGAYFDTHTIKNLIHEHSLLAYEMNYEPLKEVYGAPLRLRVENQLGFKMVKWVRSIEFVETYATVGAGEGGYNEDHEYFGELANI